MRRARRGKNEESEGEGRRQVGQTLQTVKSLHPFKVNVDGFDLLDTSGMHADLGRLMPLKEHSGNPLHKRKFSENCAIVLERTQRFAELLDALPTLLVACYFPHRELSRPALSLTSPMSGAQRKRPRL